MSFKFKQGQQLLIELTSSEIIEGEYVAGGKDRIEVINISVYPSQQKIKGPLSYYRLEIVSVSVINENGADDEICTNCQTVQNGLSQNVIGLNQAEYERLKGLSQNCVYLKMIDNRYYQATEYISNCENIGVVCLTTSSGKMAKLSLLVISTWDHVYIFDILAYNQKEFPPELRAVLETELIKKITHDSRQLMDLLHSCYLVTTVNVFDTQVADVFVKKSQSGALPKQINNISECLVHYFNFPSVLLEKAVNMDLKKWEERPLSASRQYRAAQLATYLITLKNRLESLMLQDYYKAVGVYSKSLRNCSVIESQKNLMSKKLSDVFNNLDLKESSS